MASKLDLISNALILIGDKPLNSLDESTRRAVVGVNLYDNIKEDELTKFKWSFARQKAQISQTTTTPTNEFQYEYQLPTDMLKPLFVDPSIMYRLYGDKLYTNSGGPLYADYIANVSESFFSPSFAKLMEYALAEAFAMGIRDSAAARDEMSKKYLKQAQAARFDDAQQQPQETLQSRPFIDARL